MLYAGLRGEGKRTFVKSARSTEPILVINEVWTVAVTYLHIQITMKFTLYMYFMLYNLKELGLTLTRN